MALKIFHTSDWHLGKKLYKISRIPEQQYFLNWLIDEIVAKEINALIIAGDIFDSPIPPTEALTLYFWFLNRLINETQCNAYIIAGNHDSGQFLNAPKAILPSNRIFLAGQLAEELNLKLHDPSDNFVNIVMFPYFRSHEIMNIGKDLLLDHREDDCSSQIIDIIRALIKKPTEIKKNHKCLGNILVAHHVFGNFFPAGSEQSLTLSGLDSLPLEIFEDIFDYLALGHIHKPQPVSKTAIYSGSPIPFRFSETQEKSLQLLDFSNNTLEVHKIIIPQARVLSSITCNETDYIQKVSRYMDGLPKYPLHPLLEIKLKLASPKSEIIDHIRNLISKSNIELLAVHTILPSPQKIQNQIEIQATPDLNTLFEQYYKVKNPNSKQIDPDIKNAFCELLEEINSMEGS